MTTVTHRRPNAPRSIILAADLTALGTSYTDVTGMGFAILAYGTYRFRWQLTCDTDATTTGIDTSINGPASPVLLGYMARIWLSATACSDYCNTGYDTSYNGGAGNGASCGTTARAYVIDGMLQNGATAGTVIPRIKREAVGTGPNVRAGSYGLLWRVD